MAYIDPNKAAQINQTLNAMKSTLQNISAGLKTTPPSVVQQIAPSLSAALSSAGNVLRTAGPVVSGVAVLVVEVVVILFLLPLHLLCHYLLLLHKQLFNLPLKTNILKDFKI